MRNKCPHCKNEMSQGSPRYCPEHNFCNLLERDFQEWVEKGLWQGEDEYTKNFAVGNVTDWWLDKIRSTVEEALQAERERILGKLKVYSVTAPEESRAATFTVEQFRSVLDKEE